MPFICGERVRIRSGPRAGAHGYVQGRMDMGGYNIKLDSGGIYWCLPMELERVANTGEEQEKPSHDS